MPHIDRRDFIAFLGGSAAVAGMTAEARADAIEHYLAAATAGSAVAAAPKRHPTVAELEAQIPSRTFRRGTGRLFAEEPGTVGTIRLLTALPEKPTLVDFFRHRFMATAEHCLQSARLARQKNLDEEVVFACLIHDLSLNLMRTEHGFWGAQMFEPYVSERVTFIVRHHATLRFFPDKDAGYEYPELYRTMFGSDYVVPPHQQAEYEMVRRHRWYEPTRQLTVNDLYSFEQGVKVSVDDFIDVIGRHFRQPREGLGFDGSPVAHIWRSVANPDSPL